jgi:hypothetical protein
MADGYVSYNFSNEDKTFICVLYSVWLLCVMAMMLLGCAAKRIEARIPGCNAPSVTIPQRCYAMVSGQTLEVRCPEKTWYYNCGPEVHH